MARNPSVCEDNARPGRFLIAPVRMDAMLLCKARVTSLVSIRAVAWVKLPVV